MFMAKIPKNLLGKIVEIDFYDHCSTSGVDRDSIVYCRVYGRVRNIQKDFLQIWTWEIVNEPSEDGSNEDTFKILKSAILKLKVLG